MTSGRNQASARATVRDVVRMALGAGQTPGGMEFAGVTAEGWIAEFLAQLDGRVPFAELPSPAGFQGTLRPYQIRGYSWLGFLRRWGLGACLADDMGLGKTVQTLSLIQRDWEANGQAARVIDLPDVRRRQLAKEAARFTPDLPVMVHHGLTRTKSAAFTKAAQQHAMVLSSYALLHRDFEILKQVPWAGVILDEAQNIKNPETKQAQAARALPADYRVALTGTPVENNVGDLWSIMEFLNPGFLGTQSEFKRRFFVPIQAQRDPEAVAQLQALDRAVHPTAAQDRQKHHCRSAREAGDESLLHADQRASLALRRRGQRGGSAHCRSRRDSTARAHSGDVVKTETGL